MIAAFPMYDRPETAPVYDRLWQGVRRRLSFDVPEALTRGGDLMAQWRSRDLVLSQTCGFPFRAALHGKVQLVATPVWDLSCRDGYYYSVIVVRSDDLRSDVTDFAEACLAYNEPLSQSGWAAPQSFAADHGFVFRTHIQSGAHRASALAVAEGRADVAALDAVTWALMKQHDPWTQSLRVIAETTPTPTLPYITALGRPSDTIRSALRGAVDHLTAAERAAICLRGVCEISADAYLAVPTPPTPEAVAAGTG